MVGQQEGNAMTGNTNNGGAWPGRGRRIAGWAGALLILLVPLVAMQFSDDVNWGVGDFLFAGILILGTGSLFELAVWTTGNIAYRAGAGVALAAAFMLVWITGAVGIIGSEDEAANLMYGGVLATGLIGALIARFRPYGMARALFLTALAQALVGGIALAAGLGSTGPAWPWEILGLTGFFVALFVGSALLFQKAAREQSPTGSASADYTMR